ncbi:MAG: hypothetical protein QOG88_1408 [Actinomycetota bacterium]|nr:hypothetical protein [Actinomycetota bacterium]
MNLGTARIIIILALVVAGVAVLTNAFGPGTVALTPLDPGSSTSSSPTGSTSASVSASHSPKPLPSPETTGVLVSVFSGISAPGCAAKVNTMLVGDGYVAADPAGDATRKPIAKTVVYYRIPDPQRHNQSDAINIAKTYFDSAHVSKLPGDFPGVVSGQAQAVVLIGADYVANC